MNNQVKRLKNLLGPLEIKLLAYVQLRNIDIIRTGEIAAALNLAPKQERELLSRMNRAGLIIWLKRGAYLVPSRLPASGRWAVDQNYVLSRLMKELKGKYQVSGPNAFYFYGFEDQVPNRTYVYNNRIQGEKNLGGFDFVFIKTYKSRLGAASESKLPDGETILMATKARTLLDAVYDWSRYNTLPRAYRWILETIKSDPGIP